MENLLTNPLVTLAIGFVVGLLSYWAKTHFAIRGLRVHRAQELETDAIALLRKIEYLADSLVNEGASPSQTAMEPAFQELDKLHDRRRAVGEKAFTFLRWRVKRVESALEALAGQTEQLLRASSDQIPTVYEAWQNHKDSTEAALRKLRRSLDSQPYGAYDIKKQGV